MKLVDSCSINHLLRRASRGFDSGRWCARSWFHLRGGLGSQSCNPALNRFYTFSLRRSGKVHKLDRRACSVDCRRLSRICSFLGLCALHGLTGWHGSSNPGRSCSAQWPVGSTVTSSPSWTDLACSHQQRDQCPPHSRPVTGPGGAERTRCCRAA